MDIKNINIEELINEESQINSLLEKGMYDVQEKALLHPDVIKKANDIRTVRQYILEKIKENKGLLNLFCEEEEKYEIYSAELCKKYYIQGVKEGIKFILKNEKIG